MPSITSIVLLLGAAVANAAPRGATQDLVKRQDNGNIQISSNCASTVFYEVFINGVDGVVSSGSLVTGAGAAIDYAANNAGLVIKASFNDMPSESGDVLQFEVDQDFTNNLINYDISAVNGDPFLAFGSSLNIDGCDDIVCAAGDDSCAFQFPTDNSKDHSCPGVNHVTTGVWCP